MHLNRAHADAKMSTDFLDRSAARDLGEHLVLTRRQQLLTGKIPSLALHAIGLRRIRGHNLMHAPNDRIYLERLFDEIGRAILDGVDNRWHVSARRYH